MLLKIINGWETKKKKKLMILNSILDFSYLAQKEKSFQHYGIT